MQGFIKKFETFGSVDGPGVRFVIFFGGCDMRCKFCHNPEMWQREGEPYSAEALLEKALRYKSYWGKNGGITASGGEPLIQIDFLTEFFTMAKKLGIHTALDTAGQPFSSDPKYLAKFEKLMRATDLVLLDLKEMNEKKHLLLTGVSNKNILDMAKWLSDHGKKMWIRHVLIPGLTDDTTGLRDMRAFVDSLSGIERVEILPYHVFAIPKWQKLGIKYPLSEAKVPTKEQISRAEKILIE